MYFFMTGLKIRVFKPNSLISPRLRNYLQYKHDKPGKSNISNNYRHRKEENLCIWLSWVIKIRLSMINGYYYCLPSSLSPGESFVNVTMPDDILTVLSLTLLSVLYKTSIRLTVRYRLKLSGEFTKTLGIPRLCSLSWIIAAYHLLYKVTALLLTSDHETRRTFS